MSMQSAALRAPEAVHFHGHHHQVMNESVAMQVLRRWLKAFCENDMDTLNGLYKKPFLFKPTFRKERGAVTTDEDLRAYFNDKCDVQVRLDHEPHVVIHGPTAVMAVSYTFVVTCPESGMAKQLIPAHGSFTLHMEGGEALIIAHHSSVEMPSL